MGHNIVIPNKSYLILSYDDDDDDDNDDDHEDVDGSDDFANYINNWIFVIVMTVLKRNVNK